MIVVNTIPLATLYIPLILSIDEELPTGPQSGRFTKADANLIIFPQLHLSPRILLKNFVITTISANFAI